MLNYIFVVPIDKFVYALEHTCDNRDTHYVRVRVYTKRQLISKSEKKLKN